MKHRESLSMFSATISREVLDIGWLYQHNAAESASSLSRIPARKLPSTSC